MRTAAGPSSLVETPEALLIQVRSGGVCAAVAYLQLEIGRLENLLLTGTRRQSRRP